MKNEPESESTHDLLKSQHVRDLKWAITSPSLIKNSNKNSNKNSISSQFTNERPIDEQDLAAFLTQYTSFRVGHYFEGLVLYWLEHICHLKIIAKQLQVFEENRTVGEIDFIFEDETGILHHWETAVKFYLHFPQNNPTGSHFIGPNAIDTFEKKSKRLLEHQLPFSQKHFPEVEKRNAFMKGTIFYHPDETPPTQLPETMSVDHLKGTWIRYSELPRLNDQNETHLFRILHKPYWLSPEVCHSSNDNLKSFEELTSQIDAHFLNSARPLLVSVLSNQQTVYREVDRVFIVSESWPETH